MAAGENNLIATKVAERRYVMKIAVVAANGRVAQKVIKEALDRGFEVKAFSRGDDNKTAASDYVGKDIMELTKDDLVGFDAVVDGFGAWTDDEQPMHVKTSQHLCDILAGTETRLLIVGGAGSLYVNKEHTIQVKDGADFPAMFLPLANAQGQELDELRKRDDVKWTFISPAGDFQADGERSGEYILAGEELTLNDKGESIISYADYAIAMVDEIENGDHIRQRISVVRK